jgi:hypothetical protein
MTTISNEDQLTDLGPAPTPPAWCLPGTEPNTDSTGEGHLWSWVRDFGPNVWIECEDRIVDGRITRTQPQLVISEVSSRFGGDAVALGQHLIEAGNLLTSILDGQR